MQDIDYELNNILLSIRIDISGVIKREHILCVMNFIYAAITPLTKWRLSCSSDKDSPTHISCTTLTSPCLIA